MSRTPKTIAFMSYQLGFRGTETALWLFAHHNETILGNKSVIIVLRDKNKPYESYHMNDNLEKANEWFTSRFEHVYFNSNRDEVVQYMKDQNVDACFIEAVGLPDEWIPNHVPSIAHCVFRPYARATISTAIHEIVSQGIIPILPNPIYIQSTTDTLRKELNIPDDAIVFGRYGGYYQFNIQFALHAVIHVAQQNPNIYFIFMNTAPFVDRDNVTISVPNIIFLEATRDFELKRKFINTCDAMLHARDDGETFGLSTGEFALADKNIITYKPEPSKNGYEEAHIKILDNKCITYSDQQQLIHILEHFDLYKKDMINNGYHQYSCEKIINLFNLYLAKAFETCGISYQI